MSDSDRAGSYSPFHPNFNPATLILTLMLFDRCVAMMRVIIAALMVFFTGTVVEQLFNARAINCSTKTDPATRSMFIAFVRSCLHVAIRTVPLIAIGVVVSMAIALWVPWNDFSSGGAQILVIIAVALVAAPLAMPTFFEIPLALLLLSAGAPAGAAVAMLIAGPAINLPSLFTIARSTNSKVATSVAVTVFLLSVFGGLLVGLI
ncbi:MAG TPA: permease [Pyrinomonadaceae bacterium]